MIDAVCGRAQYASPYGNAYAIPTTNYAQSYSPSPEVQSIWSGSPIIVNDYQNIYNNNENFYEPAQPWRRRDFQAKYAQHYAEYLRKYPRRLQPVYNTSEDFDEK